MYPFSSAEDLADGFACRDRSETGSAGQGQRRGPDSNRCTRLCRPLPNLSATAPGDVPWYPGRGTTFGVGDPLRQRVQRALQSGEAPGSGRRPQAARSGRRHADRLRRGAAGAEVMFVGEQPGDHEDMAGRPFVGPAGQLSTTPSGRHRPARPTSPTPSSTSSGAPRQAAHPPEAELVRVRRAAVARRRARAPRAARARLPRRDRLAGAARPASASAATAGRCSTPSSPCPALTATLHPSAILRGDPRAASKSTRPRR